MLYIELLFDPPYHPMDIKSQNLSTLFNNCFKAAKRDHRTSETERAPHPISPLATWIYKWALSAFSREKIELPQSSSAGILRTCWLKCPCKWLRNISRFCATSSQASTSSNSGDGQRLCHPPSNLNSIRTATFNAGHRRGPTWMICSVGNRIVKIWSNLQRV